MAQNKFPSNLYPLVKPEDYFKFYKVNFSEDFVGENFREMGWDVYTPIQDKGIDRIAVKYVCEVPGHTKLNENLKSCKCKVEGCNKDSKKITRLIQIKTRKATLDSESDNHDLPKDMKTRYLGYTFKPKDFLTDPRICFLLYSDWTSNFIIFPIYEFMKLMRENSRGNGFFKSSSFKQGNDKKNNIYYIKKEWFLGKNSKKISLDKFVDSNGLEKISSYEIEKNFDEISKKILKIKEDDFLDIGHTGTIKSKLDENSLFELKNIVTSNKDNNKEHFTNLIKKNADLINAQDKNVKNSVAKYFENPTSIQIEFDKDSMDDDLETEE